jgi:RNA polymerase-interacting CarD/CdnL/TRCF family regulator
VFTARIPVDNLKRAGMRPVMTKTQANEIIKGIGSKSTLAKYDFNGAKEEVYVNDPLKTVPILNYIWINKDSLSKNEIELMWQIVDNLAREVAFVTKGKFGQVKEHLTKKLNKLSSDTK